MYSFESFVGTTLLSCVSVVILFVFFFVTKYQYWRKKGLPYLESKIPYGNFGNPFYPKEHIGISTKTVYDAMKRNGWKHGGAFMLHQPVYLPIDLDYLKNVMTKDFETFNGRGNYHNEQVDPLSAHLFNLDGPKWRNLRVKMTPTFTSGKMKMMFQSLMDCEPNLQRKVLESCEKGKPIDIKEELARFTTDVIGSCAFGLDFKTFQDEESRFRYYGIQTFELSTFMAFKRAFIRTFPSLGKILGLRAHPKDMIDFFLELVKEVITQREINKIARKDFLQLMIELKNKPEINLTLEEITAQCFVFFAAGFETSSTTMAFALYELSKNQEIQNKAREEVNSVLQNHDGTITYDGLQEMKFLRQTIDETLRMYPPIPVVTRVSSGAYKIPESKVILEKGTRIIIPIIGIHYDEDYYPNACKFDPERFSDEKKKARHHFAHIPFGEGPRICIGSRFGYMQSLVGLASLLRHFKFTVNEKTRKILTMKKNSFVLAAEGDIWLEAHKL